MITLITILIVISSVLLVLMVLAQNPKGGGANQKKTGDLLDKLTWGFAVALIVLSIATNLVLKPASSTDEKEEDPAATEQPGGNQEE
jgi:preprotein translocase subunit SecG